GGVPATHRRRTGARARRGARGRPVGVSQPSLWRGLEPRWRTLLRRFGETRAQGGGKPLALAVVGAGFWLAAFGVLYRILRYFRGVEELGPLLAGKLLG